MNNLHKFAGLAVLGLALALGGCGSSAGQVRAAEQAHYQGDKDQLFQAVESAVAAKYPVAETEQANLLFKTVGRWYTPEGLSASERLDDIRDVPDQSVHVAYYVKLLPDAGAYVVDVKEEIYRYHAGTPEPEPLKEDDISLPGFVHEKKEALMVTIHDALKGFEVKAGPQVVPAGGPPGAAEGTGTGAGTGTGSAAGAGTGSAAETGTGSGTGTGTGTGSAAGSASPAP